METIDESYEKENLEGKSSNGSRFRVNRIDSLSVGCKRNRADTPSKDHFANHPSIESNCDFANHSVVPQPQQLMVIRPKMAQRRVSIADTNTVISSRRKSSGPDLPSVDEIQEHVGTNATVGLYGKSLYRYTREALPKLENYRDVMSLNAAQRPTIDELLDEEVTSHERKSHAKVDINVGEENAVGGSIKFGWIEGCLVRCLLNIWGVMLFLRLSWMVGQAGIAHSMIIIVISTVTTTITSLSMSAIATNGEIKGGGIYYMISRSLGPAAGGSLGALFAFANSAMAALNIIGFSESLIAVLSSQGISIIDGGQNDNRIISVLTMFVLQSIILIGMEWEAKAQVGLLVILLVAMGDFVVGAFMGPKNEQEIVKGFVGFNTTVLEENFSPGYRFSEGQNQDFFSIFSIFFPAVAGIQAGASISGDLKDPGEAIPKGTLLAIFITSASYALFVLLSGFCVLREANGDMNSFKDWSFSYCANNKTCSWGLYNDYQVMQLISVFGPLIYAGCFAATLSSALSCLVSGPKMFQALSKDKVYPYLTRFGQGYGASDDPYWSYMLGFFVALIFILIADLNAVAPLISNFFMATYAVLNFCTFHASLVKPMGWRPRFKYYNTWLSLLGAILCVAIMFLMSWITALISLGCVIALFITVIYRAPNLNWGSSTRAQTYYNALSALQSLAIQEDHVKNYRPQILCLTGFPPSRPNLVDFAFLMTKAQSLLVFGHIMEEQQHPKTRKKILQNGNIWLKDRKVKGFYVLMDNCELPTGAVTLLKATGIGKMSPNIILLGFKNDWWKCERKETGDYYSTIIQALEGNIAVCILRLQDGLNSSSYDSLMPNGTGMRRIMSDGNLHEARSISEEDIPTASNENPMSNDSKISENSDFSGDLDPKTCIFQKKQEKGTIDVWWLYDDGGGSCFLFILIFVTGDVHVCLGLTLLLPYLLSTRKSWSATKLRVFALANKREQMEQELQGIASLLSKFRIDYADLTLIPDVTKKAQPDTKALFDSVIRPFMGDPDTAEDPNLVIGDAELYAMKEKTNRHLRLRELLQDYSTHAKLVVMTLPVPKRETVTAPLYMAWLELLTKDMPPFLLVRGNQTSVLTYYS